MVRVSEVRGAADDVVGEFIDSDEEYDLYQELVADEQFGELAFVKNQLAIQDKYADLEGDVDAHTDRAADALDAALEARVEQIREEVVDGR
jgi:hypothetical protein